MSQQMQHLTSQEKVEWYTPPDVVELVRTVLGYIALDPASDPTGNATVKAAAYYSQNGLTRPWYGPLFCNPPYNGQASKWTDRFLAEYAKGHLDAGGIFLVNACPGYQWWERAWRGCWSCLAEERIPFLQADGSPLFDERGNPVAHKKGSTFLYLGPNPALFRSVFSRRGRVFPPEAQP